MTTFIYALIDPRDNIIKYIGKSNNPTKRYYHHIGESKRGYKSKKSNWIRKLLSEGLKPSVQIIEECDISIWEERERYWIKYHQPNTNQMQGGGGLTVAPHALITSKIVYQFDLCGNLISTYPSINEAARQTGLDLPNISNVCNGKHKMCGGFIFTFNPVHSTKIIASINKNNLGTPKQVAQYDKDGTLIDIYKSVTQAAQALNCLRTSITNCITGRSKIAKGYIWKYIND